MVDDVDEQLLTIISLEAFGDCDGAKATFFP
jgi:hypothetical protein